MKKILLSLVVSSAALVSLSVRADVIWQEPFNYADGSITNSGLWFIHSGTANPEDALINHKRLEISTSEVNPFVPRRQDDVHRNFATTSGSPFTNSVQPIYASFIVNFTNLPTVAGAYFAHFYTNSSTLNGRVWALIGTNLTGVPNSFRLGVSGGSSATVTRIYPVDLATNVDYQVVTEIDAAAQSAYLWINPISQSDFQVHSVDTTGFAANLIVNAFGFRQATGFGGFTTISNLTLATTWDEAATNSFKTNATAPIIIYSPQSRTNFVGDNFNVAAGAAGQNMTTFTYQWRQNGAPYSNPNGNSNILAFANAQLTDSGNYDLVVTDGSGLMVTSAVASVTISNVTFPPIITTQPPTNTVVYTHQNASLSVVAYPNSGISYAWYTTNSGSVTGNPQIAGDGTSSITISDVQPSNNTTGAYYVVASNPFGSVTSVLARVSVIPPPAVSIAYLRTLVDSGFTATNSTSLFTVTGTITTFTNLTTANTASYYLQDGTGGINMFATFGQTFRPMQGDIVKYVGFMSSFRGTLELEADTVNNPATGYTILSSSNALPAPKVIAWAGLATNNNPNAEFNLEGSIVMLTNVYFGTNAGAITSSSQNSTYTITNALGQVAYINFSSQDNDTTNRTLPSFAYSVIGALTQTTNTHPGYEVTVTRWADIVTSPPPPATLAISHAGNNSALSWQNVGWDNVNNSYGSNYSYTVLASQPSYGASLAGANEVPANSSTATGTGNVVVSPDGTSITVNFSFSGLSAPATAAHIHGPAGAGTNASVLFPFSGVPNATSGSIPTQSFALTPTNAWFLFNGLLYMNVHNVNFPGGEIRDQLRPVIKVAGPYVPQYSFQAPMRGVNENPVNTSTSTGIGRVVLSPDQTSITVDMSFSGLSAPATAAHIHGPAGPGTNAAVLFPFSGVPNATSGSIPQQTFAITATQVGYLQSGLLYMNVHNSIYPGGEARAQLVVVPSSGLTFANTAFTNTVPTTATYSDSSATSPQTYYKVVSP